MCVAVELLLDKWQYILDDNFSCPQFLGDEDVPEDEEEREGEGEGEEEAEKAGKDEL